MSKGDKKQRREAKRKEKRLAARRRESVSPVKRLADAPGEVECWMSEDFESVGQRQLYAYKHGAGLSGIACFLVDRGVVGLKDAWTRIGIERGEFDEMVERAGARGIRMRRVGVEEVRRWVAGGIRWAHENGMRLPKDWAKPASLIGGVGDWGSADVSGFAREFAGHPEDLRRRLIGEPMETYLRRTDIDFQFDETAPYMDPRTGQYAHPNQLERQFDEYEEEEGDEGDEGDVSDEELDALAADLEPVAMKLTADTVRWAAERNETPSTELFEAWTSMLMAMSMSRWAMPDRDRKEIAEFGNELMESLSKRIEASRMGEYERAVDQIHEYAKTDLEKFRKTIRDYRRVVEADEERGDE